MRSKKDRDTIVIVSAGSQKELKKVLRDNQENWLAIEKPEVDALLSEFPHPTNRAERRGNKEKPKHRGTWPQKD